MKSIKSRIGAAVSAITVALGTVAVPTLPVTSAVAVGLSGALTAQPAHAEAGWRVCGVAVHFSDRSDDPSKPKADNGNRYAIIYKVQTTNAPLGCNGTIRSGFRSDINSHFPIDLGDFLSWDSLDMARCETMPVRIGANKMDICESMSSGQTISYDVYTTKYVMKTNTFTKTKP